MLTDVRLGLGYGAVAIAAVTFYYDYRQGWDQTKYFTFFAVIAYFILNGLLTLWIWGVERGKVYTGEYPGEPKPTLVRTAPPPRGPANAGQISIASSTKKHSPMYSLTVRYASADSADPFSRPLPAVAGQRDPCRGQGGRAEARHAAGRRRAGHGPR